MQTTNNFIYVAEKLGRTKYKPLYSAKTYEKANQTLQVLQNIETSADYVIVCTRKIFNVKQAEQIPMFDFA